MKTISESIRALRRARGFTQEALAEKLGVVPQTISKWESGTSLPDVSMIIPLASIFGVSTDVIHGVTPDSQESEIAETRRYLDETDASNEKCAETWRAVVARYPNNFTARLELAFAYYCMKSENDGYNSAIEQLERILDECTDADIRSEAIDFLINAYTRVGRVEDAIRTAGCAPTIRACRDFLMAQIDGSPTQNADRQTLLNFCVLEVSWNLRHQHYERIEDKIHAYKTALTVLDAVYYDGHGEKEAHREYRDIYVDLARAFAQIGRQEEMYANLDRAFEETSASESLPVGTYFYTENKFVTAARYIHDLESNGYDWVYLAYWITDRCFDAVRGDERFREFEAKVRARVAEKGRTQTLAEWMAE